jgi:hypothetical protein
VYLCRDFWKLYPDGLGLRWKLHLERQNREDERDEGLTELVDRFEHDPKASLLTFDCYTAIKGVRSDIEGSERCPLAHNFAQFSNLPL